MISSRKNHAKDSKLFYDSSYDSSRKNHAKDFMLILLYITRD
eukprot:UN15175